MLESVPGGIIGVSGDFLKLSLRRCTPDDGEIVLAWRNQPSSVRFQASPKRSVEQIRALLAEQAIAPLTPTSIGRFHWIGEVDGEPVSQVQLAIDERDRGQNAATLGYTVGERFHGRGIATASVRAALRIAFDPTSLAIQRLEAVAAVGNTASRRVLEKCQFQFEGIQRGLLVIQGERVDHACYAMLWTDDVVREMK